MLHPPLCANSCLTSTIVRTGITCSLRALIVSRTPEPKTHGHETKKQKQEPTFFTPC